MGDGKTLGLLRAKTMSKMTLSSIRVEPEVGVFSSGTSRVMIIASGRGDTGRGRIVKMRDR